jgi:2-haloacid dehalogenase
MTATRAVLFDLGNVLIEWEPRHVYRPLFRDPAEMERFLAEVVDADWNRAIDAGKPLLESVRERQAKRPEYAELIGLWATRWRDMLRAELPDSVAILKELKDQGTPIYALTNWSRETFPATRERFAFLGWFKDIVVSGFEGLAKPDPAFYRLAMERCGLVPAETVFVDDLQINIDAALALGFDAIRFTGAPELRRALVQRGVLTPR